MKRNAGIAFMCLEIYIVKQQKASNVPNKKDTKGKRGDSNCSHQQQAVNYSNSSSSSNSSPFFHNTKNQKKKCFKGSSPPPGLGTNTSNFKVFDPTFGLRFLLVNDFRKLSKD